MNLVTEQYVRMVNAILALKSEKGQTLVEYALLLALIAVVVIVAVGILGGKVCNVYNNVAEQLTVGN